MRTRSNVYLYLWGNHSKGGWLWDFPGSSVVKTPHFHYRVHGFSSGWKLRSYMPPNVAKRKKKRRMVLFIHKKVSIKKVSKNNI